MRCIEVLCDAVALALGMVRYGTIWYGMLRYDASMVWCYVLLRSYGLLWYVVCTMLCCTVRCCVVLDAICTSMLWVLGMC